MQGDAGFLVLQLDVDLGLFGLGLRTCWFCAFSPLKVFQSRIDTGFPAFLPASR